VVEAQLVEEKAPTAASPTQTERSDPTAVFVNVFADMCKCWVHCSLLSTGRMGEKAAMNEPNASVAG
jgi:hypothetical protein